MTAATAGWLLTGSVIRAARKQHPCDCTNEHGQTDEGRNLRCSEVIESGTTYIEYLGETAGYQSGSHYTTECARHQGVLVDDEPWEHLGTCRLPYLSKRDADAKSCECGGKPSTLYAPADR